MSIETYFKEKINQLMFLEISSNAILKCFNTVVSGSVYMPVKASRIVDNVKNNTNIEEIPVSYFVEGMLIVIGCDKGFKYNQTYRKILSNNAVFTEAYAKKSVFELIKSQNSVEGYILLKGYIQIDSNKENYDKLLMLAENLRKTNKDFKYEELNIIEESKIIDGYAEPYLYEAVILNEDADYRKALDRVEAYLSKGGEATTEVLTLKKEIQASLQYELGKEQVLTNPEGALKLLLPLLNDFEENNLLYYNIGVAYRSLNNHEKAIYYLNESIALDGEFIEVINELGLNYACIADYEKAIAYFKKAFEATRSVEICTNIISCYISKGDMKQAEIHLEIANKLDSNDEIVKQLKSIIKGEGQWS